ncbi:MAG: hypothetical protein IPH45_00795 [Bacteroidales bacterium]|nr:hypothetical protein [Bacteroidales bacterium]
MNNVFASGKKEFCEVTLSYDNKLLGNVYIEGILTSEDGDCLLTVVNLSNLKT